MKKVLIVTPYAEPEKGACTIRVNFFVQYLKTAGIAPQTLAIKRRGTGEKKGILRFASNTELFSRVFSSPAEAVIAVSPPIMPAFVAMAASKLSGKKFVLDAKDDPEFYRQSFATAMKKAKHAGFLLVRRLTYIFSDALMFLTESDLLQARQLYRVNGKKLFLVMNGTDAAIIRRDVRERAKLRKRIGATAGTVAIIYAGSLGDEEVLKFLDHCAGIIKENAARLVLMLAHDSTKYGEAEIAAVREKILSLGLESSTSLFLNIEYGRIYKILSACDIAVVPWPDSLKTSIPVKVFDYSAAGLFIIAKGPGNSELQEIFSRHSLGSYSHDWPGFVSSLRTMLGKGKSAFAGGEKNRAVAEKFFGRSLQGKKFIELLHRL